MKGIRLPIIDGKETTPQNPGEYCGPVPHPNSGLPTVYFLKPNARDADAPRVARSVHYVTSPPHVFTEEPDGTLTIRASLGDRHEEFSDAKSDGWHGYLTKGIWEKC